MDNLRSANRKPDSKSQKLGTVAKGSVQFVSTVALILTVAAFAFLAIGPRVLGYQTVTMLTGSMSPLINPGDVVVTVPVSADEIVVGDIVTYRTPTEDRRVQTHRVMEIVINPDGTKGFRTKGDANNGPDPWTASVPSGNVDRHVMTVPYLGNVIRVMREPWLRTTLMYGAPAILVTAGLISIWRKKPDNKPAKSEAVPS